MSCRPRPRWSRRWLVAGVAVAGGLALGACGDDGDAGPSTTEADRPTSSTAATSTTATTTTTTAPPSDEELIAEVVMGYTMLYERLGQPVDPDAAHLRELLTGPILERADEILRGHAASGTYYEGRFEIEIRDVTIEGGAATVHTCSRDDITRYRADGTVEAGPDDWASEADVELRRTPEGWRIAEVTTRSDDRCALG